MARWTIAALALTGAVAFAPGAHAATSDAALVKQGAYVARAADCMACHTGGDGTPYAGGYSLSSPLGDIIATNISPSKQFGIGAWTEAQFADAVRKGVAPDGHLYPAMPYTAYATMSDADIHALYAYIMQDVKPVDRAPSVSTKLPFPFNQRLLMIGWNMMFAGGTPADSGLTGPGGAKRGEYLVKTLAHCSTCHTPRNIAMAEKSSQFLAGAPLGGWHAPNITSDAVSGIGGWSSDEVIAYLRTGAAHGKAQAAGGMAEAVEHSLRFLTDDDIAAIAAYLKTVPAVRDPAQKQPAFSFATPKAADLSVLDRAVDRSPDAMKNGTSVNGQELYVGACATCHQLNGQGTQDQFYPSLTANTATGATSPNNLILAVLKGIQRQTNDGKVAMSAFEDQMSSAQVAAVTNYVLSHFGNAELKVSEQDVDVLKSGDNKPKLLEALPWVMAGAGLVIVLLIAALAMRFRSRTN